MADFSTGAELTVSVNQSSLSDARDTIESELGDIEVDVNAVVSGGSQPRDPSSGQFLGIEGVEQRVVNTNDTLDSLIQIENERWELDKIRNDYLEDLAETSALPGGGRAAGGGGGGSGILQGLGIRGLLGGIGLSGGGAAAASVGLPLAGGSLGKFFQNLAQENLPEGATTTTENVVSGTSVTQMDLQASSELKELFDEFSTRNTDTMVSGTSVNLSEQEWPPLPDFTQNFEWPEPPEFDLNPFDGGGRGAAGVPGRGRIPGAPQQQQQQDIIPEINLGGITVDVTTTIDDAVDDAVQEVETTVDREVSDLERRVSEALGGFF